MTMQKILIQIDNHIGIITLNNPEKHNALNPEMMSALLQAYRDFENDHNVKVIILNANGKHFCVGADLSHMSAMAAVSWDENVNDAKQLADFFKVIYRCKKPTIACVQGSVRGGGLGLLAVHDIVVAAVNTTFSFTEVKLGLAPAVISPFILQRIAYQDAKYFMLMADIFDAEKAASLKLIDCVCEEKALLETAMKTARVLSEHDPAALTHTKHWLQQLRPITQAQLDEAAQLLATLRSSEVAKARMREFLKKA